MLNDYQIIQLKRSHLLLVIIWNTRLSLAYSGHKTQTLGEYKLSGHYYVGLHSTVATTGAQYTASYEVRLLKSHLHFACRVVSGME